MKNINSVAISGNLTRDPEQNGPAVKFTVAVNDRTKDGDEWTDRPNYIDCVVFGKYGEVLLGQLRKGIKVCVQGRLRWSSWEKDGKKRSKVEVAADTVEVLAPRDDRPAENLADEEIPF